MKRATCCSTLLLFITNISIHALVKRATPYAVYGTDKGAISIHALVKRATIFGNVNVNDISISIHALVKRATFYAVKL